MVRGEVAERRERALRALGIALDERTEATVLLPEPGRPPRELRVALWGDDLPADPADPVDPADPAHPADPARPADPADSHSGEEVELVLPTARGVRRKRVAARVHSLAEVLDVLTGPLPDDSTPSVRALARAVEEALGLVARGRLLPSMSGDGSDAWRVGPLDPADHRRLAALAEALPPALHAVPVPGSRPLRMTSAEAVVAAVGDAVADTLVRTAAAPVWGRAFATPTTTDVSAAQEWLRAAASGTEHEVSVALRLEPPWDVDLDAGLEGCTAVLQVQSVADPSLALDAADLWSAPDVVRARFGTDVETTLLLALRRGARVWPPLQRLLDAPRPETLELADAEASDLLGPLTDDLAGAGIQVLWPNDLLAPVTVTASVGTETPGSVTPAMFDLLDLVEVRFTVLLDGEALTDDEVAALAEAKRGVVRLRGRWVRADRELLRRARARRQIGAGEALGLALGGGLELGGEPVAVEVTGPLALLAERLRQSSGPRALSPEGLRAELRPYQERGVAWLLEMAALGLGGVLADDMGLGKTVQLLGLHVARHDRPAAPADDTLVAGPTLVVCPVTLLANWEREAARFAPGVEVRRYHGAQRDLDDVADDGIVLTTYGVVRRDAASLAEVGWGLVVADEAQAVKNPLGRTARQLRTIGASARFALTGTPVENRLSELWALLDWTTPGLLGPLERFRTEVAVPIERHRDPEATEALARLVRPFVLRRRKIDPDVLVDLPPKTETDRMVLLTTEQATLYRALTAEVLERVEQEDGMARRGLVLKLLTGLKQICDHPALYLRQDGPVLGRSGKLATTLDLLDVIAAEGETALVFTQYVGMGRILEACLADAGRRVAFLHGSVPLARRQAMVDDLQAGRLDVLLLSLKAGGTGLNLTRATHVVHYDRWWNPAVEDQASDRAWRIGQDRPVQVHRMVCEGTLEERIAQMLDTKRELAEAVVGAGEGWITELDDDALRDLVALSADADLDGADR